MDERLYIDNELVDIDSNTKIVMNVKSNLFRDISKIASNSTYTVRLPKSVRNQMLLLHTDLVQSKDGYPYVAHKAQYFRNGVQVIKDGKVTILRVTDDSIEISILWGLFSNFSKLLSEGAVLNQLRSDARILFKSANAPIDYAECENNGYFYAEYDVWKTDTTPNYNWRTGSGMIYPSMGEIAESSVTNPYKNKTYDGSIHFLHPVVKVSWLIDLIKQNKGVDFRFVGDAKQYINTLVIPLISKKSNELTYEKSFQATLKPINNMGGVPLTIQEDSVVFDGAVGADVSSLRVKGDANVIFDIKGEWEFDMSGANSNGYFGGGTFGNSKGGSTTDERKDTYLFHYGYWLKMTITNGGEIEEYVIGNDKEHFRVIVPKDYKGVCRYQYSAYGKIAVKAGSIIKFEWLSNIMLKDAKFLGGTLKATLQADDNVPTGGYFPIAANLPNIKIIDFVKFLAAITGTFPLQMSQDDVVQFFPLSTIWNNKREAKDWTRRLIAQGAENKPKEIEFVFNEYGQHNYYKWKADDAVKGYYDGDLQVNNDTLEAEKTIFEFPFAATDGDNVPMYKESAAGEKELVGEVTIGEKDKDKKNGTKSEDKGPSYAACKDRILRLRSSDKGKAQAFFDINMQEIINTKYRNISDSMQRAKIITEKMRIRDLELLNFDETKPIYLAQYGSYFAITEIKAEQTGLADVTMLQLYFNI